MVKLILIQTMQKKLTFHLYSWPFPRLVCCLRFELGPFILENIEAAIICAISGKLFIQNTLNVGSCQNYGNFAICIPLKPSILVPDGYPLYFSKETFRTQTSRELKVSIQSGFTRRLCMKSVLWPILDMRILQTQPLNDYISKLSELQNVRNWNRGMDKINFQHLCFVHFTTFGRNLSKKCGSPRKWGSPTF